MIPEFESTHIKQLKQLLEGHRKIVITTHHKPDGDAMGSSLALRQYLVNAGHSPVVITPSDYPDFLDWMKGNDNVVVYTANRKKADKLIDEADIIFCLDFNHLDRTESMCDRLSASDAKKVLIDHHLEPEDFADIAFSFPKSCATCEILYHVLIELDKTLINKDIAEALYAGIMTDTGSFRFSSTSSDTHRVVAELVDLGADGTMIHEKILDDFSENRTKFLGHCLLNNLQVVPEYRTAFMTVSMEEQRRFNNKTGDTEGLVNYALSVRGVVMACLFIEKEGLIKISLRSKGDFSVRDLAANHFMGGGHKNAAGGKSLVSLHETLTKFLDLLPAYKGKLLIS
jgi:phosphoesterase RecJ-like protein